MESTELVAVEAAPARVMRSAVSLGPTAQRWAERREYWQGLLERHAVSGQSIPAFCAATGVAFGSFYRWRRKLGLAPEPPPAPLGRSGFVELTVGGIGGTAGVVLELGDGRRLVLDRGFDREALAVLLELLARVSG